MIAIVNRKNGVSKTTTRVKLGIGLAMENKEAFLANLDPTMLILARRVFWLVTACKPKYSFTSFRVFAFKP
ncbi:AAA family ATPase [Proteiniborus ethanoligenes]|uniref:AAA family ATPase n=1 Tax=Proteiniborus ethanoligenes TaxID=415015 RepID=UPI00115FDABE